MGFKKLKNEALKPPLGLLESHMPIRGIQKEPWIL